jgi:hypothetical protein
MVDNVIGVAKRVSIYWHPILSCRSPDERFGFDGPFHARGVTGQQVSQKWGLFFQAFSFTITVLYGHSRYTGNLGRCSFPIQVSDRRQTRLRPTRDKWRLGLPGHCCFAFLPPLIPYFVTRDKWRLGLPGHCCFAFLPPLIPYFVRFIQRSA